MKRYKPVGWRNDSHRHSLAAKGVSSNYYSTKGKYFATLGKKWMQEVPQKDDFGMPITTEFIDGKTKQGPWAIMSLESFKQHGAGLGVGQGQRYLKDGNEWPLIEGSPNPRGRSEIKEPKNIYQENGYANRKEYLKDLAKEHGVDEQTVFAVADMLGPNEDFDGLVSSLEDEKFMAKKRALPDFGGDTEKEKLHNLRLARVPEKSLKVVTHDNGSAYLFDPDVGEFLLGYKFDSPEEARSFLKDANLKEYFAKKSTYEKFVKAHDDLRDAQKPDMELDQFPRTFEEFKSMPAEDLKKAMERQMTPQERFGLPDSSFNNNLRTFNKLADKKASEFEIKQKRTELVAKFRNNGMARRAAEAKVDQALNVSRAGGRE